MALAPSEVFVWYMIFTTETQDLNSWKMTYSIGKLFGV